MIGKVDHIGIAVLNINKSLELYNFALGIECTKIEFIENQKITAAMLKLGDVNIELMQPSDDDSPIKKFIDKRGEGIHHIALSVTSIEEEIKKLKNLGYKFTGENVISGVNNSKNIFLHPKSCGGVLIELTERHDENE